MQIGIDEIPDVEEIHIRYYTTSQFIKANFTPKTLQLVDNAEDADLIVYESQVDNQKEEFHNNMKLCFDQSISGCDCIMEKSFTLRYLNLVDQMRTDEGFVGMTDPIDVFRVTRGSLYYYSKHDFSCLPNDLIISLPDARYFDEVGVIVYLSQNDSMLLSRISDWLAKKYTRSSIVMMQPSMRVGGNESEYEIFIFKW